MRQCGLKLGSAADRCRHRLNTERRCRSFYSADEQFSLRGGFGIEDESNPLERWRHLLEQIGPLARDRELGTGEAGDVPAWTSQVGYESLRDWIGDAREYDWNGAGRSLQSGKICSGSGKQHIRL